MAPNKSYWVFVYSIAQTTAGNRIWVRNASTVQNLDPIAPVYPIGAGNSFSYIPGLVRHNQHKTFTLPPSDWTRVLGVSAWALQRRSAGPSNTTIYAYANHTSTSPSPCTGSCFKSGSHAFFSTSSRRFVIAYELGHAIGSARNGWQQTDHSYQAGPDACDGEVGPNNQPAVHAIHSKEYQLAAANEGFTHYYAAVAFNNSGQTDCSFAYYKAIDWDHDGTLDPQTVDCENGPALTGGGTMSSGDYLDEECSSGGTTNRGTEYDWLRFFWDLDTNASTGATIHTTQIGDIWDEANPHSWRPEDAGFKKRPWPRIEKACDDLAHDCGTAAFNGVDQ